MRKSTLEKDNLSANTLIARLVSSEEIANLPGTKLDVYIDGTIQYEAFVRVGVLPQIEDAQKGIFYILPDNTVWYLDDVNNWQSVVAETDKPDSIYKSLVEFTEGIGLEGTCNAEDIEGFDPVSASTMLGNIFFYTQSGKIAALEAINGSTLTYRVLVSPADGVNSWIIQVNNIPNASTLRTLDTLTIRWDNINLIYDGQGNTVERQAFRNSIRLGENVYLQEAQGHPWAIGTMRSNNTSELVLSIREDLRYSKNGFWVINTDYGDWTGWGRGDTMRSIPADNITKVYYYENGAYTELDAYDMLEQAKLNQIIYLRNNDGTPKAVGAWNGPGGTNLRFIPLLYLEEAENPAYCWIDVDETQFNLDDKFEHSQDMWDGNAIMIPFTVIKEYIYNKGGVMAYHHGYDPTLYRHLTDNDMLVIADSNGIPRYQSIFMGHSGPNPGEPIDRLDCRIWYPFPRVLKGKVILNTSSTLDISDWEVNHYVTVPYNSILTTDYYTDDNHENTPGLTKFAQKCEPLYLHVNGKPKYKAFVSQYDDTNSELHLFLTDYIGSPETLQPLTKQFRFNWEVAKSSISPAPTPEFIFTKNELEKVVDGDTHKAERIELEFNGYLQIVNKGSNTSNLPEAMGYVTLDLTDTDQFNPGEWHRDGYRTYSNYANPQWGTGNEVRAYTVYSGNSGAHAQAADTFKRIYLSDIHHIALGASGTAGNKIPFNMKVTLSYAGIWLYATVEYNVWHLNSKYNYQTILSNRDRLLNYGVNVHIMDNYISSSFGTLDYIWAGAGSAKAYFN